MVAAVVFFTKGLVLKRVGPSGVAAFLMGVEFVKFMGGEWCDTEEGLEEDFQVFVVSRENGIDGEWGERDVNDGQCKGRVIHLGSEAMDDGGTELVHVREVEVEAAAMFEPLGAQGTLVEAACGVDDGGMVLEFAVTSSGEDAMRAVKRWQDRRHSLVGNDDLCRRIKAAFICSSG